MPVGSYGWVWVLGVLVDECWLYIKRVCGACRKLWVGMGVRGVSRRCVSRYIKRGYW